MATKRIAPVPREMTTEWIALDEIFSADYQRNISKNTIAKLRRAFDLKKMGVLYVSHREGRYWMLDGQHRAAVAREKGYTHALCRIYDGLTIAEEAALRAAFNDQKRDTALDKWALDLASGDANAIALNALMQRHGYYVALRGAVGAEDKHIRTVRYIGTLREIQNHYRAWYEILDRIFPIMLTAWGDGDELATSRIVNGLMRFVYTYRDLLNDQQFGARLGRHKLSWYETEVDSIARATGRHVTNTKDLLARIFLREYNRRRSSKRLPNRLDIAINEDIEDGPDETT